MSSPRFQDRNEPLRYLRVGRVLVRCPRCAGPAVATPVDTVGSHPVDAAGARVSCAACGFAREGHGPWAPASRVDVVVEGRCGRCGRWVSVERRVRQAGHPVPTRCPGCGAVTRHGARLARAVGARGGPRFMGLELWLQVPCAGRVLWAYDEAHLDYLERYVAARLREQEPGWRSLASRLPSWLKAARHRGTVGQGLARLRAMLPA